MVMSLGLQHIFKTNITRKFIEDTISLSEKELQMAEVENEIDGLNLELNRLQNYKSVNEELIDRAMVFISDPEAFWNQSSTPIKKLIQQFIAPDGIPYDFETGYGTPESLHSYLLIKKIASKEAENSSLVAATGIEPVTLGL